MPSKIIKKQASGYEMRHKLLLMALAASSADCTPINKQPNKARRQMVWEERVASLTSKEFERRYRMDLGGFNSVLGKIGETKRPASGPMRPNVPTVAKSRQS